MDHFLKTFTPFSVGRADALVGVHFDHLPVLTTVDVLVIEVHLRLVARSLLFKKRAHTGISGHAFFGSGFGSVSAGLHSCFRNLEYRSSH